jgi:uncharacterized protein (DUF3820 family)
MSTTICRNSNVAFTSFLQRGAYNMSKRNYNTYSGYNGVYGGSGGRRWESASHPYSRCNSAFPKPKWQRAPCTSVPRKSLSEIKASYLGWAAAVSERRGEYAEMPDWRRAVVKLGNDDIVSRAGKRMGFGKYKGEPCGDVICQDQSYIEWMTELDVPTKDMLELMILTVDLMDLCAADEKRVGRVYLLDSMRKCGMAVIATQRLWRLADECARTRFSEERQQQVEAATTAFSLVVGGEDNSATTE